MSRRSRILYRRRQGDWQTRLFSYVGLPPLELADLEGAAFAFSEIVKPRLNEARKEGLNGVSHFEEREGIRVFKETLTGLVGANLENAAAELLLTSSVSGERSDWEAFTAWVVHRSQPLSSRLIEGFARFYVARLNRALKRACLRRVSVKASEKKLVNL